MVNYYKAAHGVDIKNAEQPLFESEVKGKDGKDLVIYLVPELCQLSGIDDSMIADRNFMTELAYETKFNPKGIKNCKILDCIAKIESGRNLCLEKTKKKDALVSSFDLCNKFELKIENAMEPKGTYLPLALLSAAGSNIVVNF